MYELRKIIFKGQQAVVVQYPVFWVCEHNLAQKEKRRGNYCYDISCDTFSLLGPEAVSQLSLGKDKLWGLLIVDEPLNFCNEGNIKLSSEEKYEFTNGELINIECEVSLNE